MAKYTIDTAHSSITFSVRHMIFAKVRGRFTKWTAELAHDAESPWKTTVTATIDAASIDTNEPQRDGHLRSPDFFDVSNHSAITFASRQVASHGDKHWAVTGDLTMHGVTHAIVLDVEEVGRGKDPWGNARVLFAAKGSLDRRDFGLQWNQVLETGGVLVGEKVEFEVDVEAIETAA
ncbi:MAG: YceI family protein [Polyangiaceae bacterium]|jgi:polyisoprenoid-binding protein YceI